MKLIALAKEILQARSALGRRERNLDELMGLLAIPRGSVFGRTLKMGVVLADALSA